VPAVSKRYLWGQAVDQLFAQEDVAKTLTVTDRYVWLLQDKLGTVRDVLDRSGGIVARVEYNAFGVIQSVTNAAGQTIALPTRWLYTCQEYDPITGNIWFSNGAGRGRWYSPTLNRFLQPDDLGFAAGDMNLYRPVGNSPTNFTDPSGRAVQSGKPNGQAEPAPADETWWQWLKRKFNEGPPKKAADPNATPRKPQGDPLKDFYDHLDHSGRCPDAGTRREIGKQRVQNQILWAEVQIGAVGIAVTVGTEIVLELIGGKVAGLAVDVLDRGIKGIRVAFKAGREVKNIDITPDQVRKIIAQLDKSEPGVRHDAKNAVEYLKKNLDEQLAAANKAPTNGVDSNATTANPKGGSYNDVRKGNSGGHANHIPPKSVSPYSKGKSPAIFMEPEDHRLTESYGSGKRAKEHRRRQSELIEQGKLREAMQMDIDDIQGKFGDKYDAHIKEMLGAYGFNN